MEPRYTIEQIYLLKRLRQTGMSKDEILCALDTMEMLDTEFENRQSFMRPSYHSNRTNRPHENRNSGNYSNTSENHRGMMNTGPVVNATTHNNPHGQSNYSGPQVPTNQSNYSSNYQETGLSRGDDIGNDNSWQNKGSGDVSNTQIHTPEDEEVTELIRKGTLAVKEEIKEFMAERKLSQSYVSQKTGISQSYISLFLVQGVEMKSHTQRLLYQWYIQEKKMPGRPNPAMNWFHGSTPQMQQKSTMDDTLDSSLGDKGDKGNATAKKRERFVWKDACIPILEKYFQQNQYPDDYEREVIADACNSVIQIPGYELPPDKLVTPSKVYNWFCNKRKDQRRRKHIAELEAASNDHTRLSSPNSGSTPVKAECGSPGDCTIVAETRSNPSPNQDPMQLAVEMAAVNHSILALVNQHGDDLSSDSSSQLKDFQSMDHSEKQLKD